MLTKLEQDRIKKNKPLWAPLPGPQTEAVNSPADICFVGGAAGGGKMLPLHTSLATPAGWTTIGDLVMGDAVFDEQGQTCRVVAVHPIDIAPQSYRLTFDDNTSIVACADHLWLTFNAAELNQMTRHTPQWRAARRVKRPSRSVLMETAPDWLVRRSAAVALKNTLREWTVMAVPTGTVRTTREIAATLLTPRGRRNHAIPMARPLQLPDAELPIDPYMLGTQLGDGKRIPQIYLRGSMAQRIALLQGLMDIDGDATDRGACEFTTTNPLLRDGMAELLASLGIKAGGSGPKYRFKFFAPFPAFRLKRKADRQKPSERRALGYRYVTACDSVDPEPMRCITVDSPSGLYLAGRQMVPTHNTDLVLGLAIMHHWRSIIFRREYQQLKGARDRCVELLTGKGSYNGAIDMWRLDNGKVIEFGALQKEEDRLKFQGRPHDGLFVDEITHLTESQFRFIMGWNRSTREGQRVRAVVTGNPPTDASGDWVIAYWAPWLDRLHPNPAASGELRWYASLDGKDVERPDGEPFEHPNDRTGEMELIQPISRTFIRAWVKDNPYLMRGNYVAQLQALPEPLRSKLWLGDFSYGREDHSSQVLPTAWVLAAQNRWTEQRPGWVDAIGVDVGRGGGDKTVLSLRSGAWMDHQLVTPGSGTPDAQSVIQRIAAVIPVGHTPNVQIDVIGVGAAVYDLAVLMEYDAYPLNSARASHARDRSGQLGFANKRAEWWWSFRERLDPDSKDEPIALPPDRELLSDLTAPRWKLTIRGVQVEVKDDIRARIGRSIDKGDSCIYCYAVPTLPPVVRLV